MSKRITRRQFLQAGGLTAAACVISGCTVNLQRKEYLESFVRPPEEELPGQNVWFATACRQCSGGCGVIVRTSNGRARKIEGNPLHPINAGKLCARGQAALQELYDPDRLRNAVRQDGRGSLNFGPIYWDDAIQQLSDQVRGVEPGSIAFLAGNPSSHFWQVLSRFAQALGARPPVVYTLGDDLIGASGRLYGTESAPLFDVANADVVLSFGANWLEDWLSPVHYGRAYGQMRRRAFGRRGVVVQFEPRLSPTGVAADEWVQIKPGTEGLVALALGKIAAEAAAPGRGGGVQYDGVDAGQIAEASGVAAETLERIGRLFASVPNAVAIPGSRLAARAGGEAALAAVNGLNLLAGNGGKPGGIYVPPATASDDFFSPPPLSSYADVRALIGDMAAGRVKVLLVHGSNPAFELPAASGWREALAKVPFVVSFSPTVDDTAAQADLILPDRTNLESWGYHVPAVADRLVISGQQPVVRPLYDTRASADVLLALAQGLGGALGQALPWPNEVEMLQEAIGGLWTEWRRQGGRWAEQAGWQAPAAGQSQTINAADMVPQPATADYPYTLHLYPAMGVFDGRGANKPWLQETPDTMTTVSWQTWIEIHPDTAAELGVKDNDIVRVISPAGEVEAIVYVYPAIEPSVVAMPIGRGHEHYGRFAKGMGSNPMRLVAGEPVAGTGAAAWGLPRVRIEPAGRKRKLARLESADGVYRMLETE